MTRNVIYGWKFARRIAAVVVIIGLTGCVPSDPVVATGNKLAAPAILPSGAAFSASVQVMIASTILDVTIRYTLDGTTPSSAAGAVYTGPFTLTQTTTVRAVALKDGKDPSDVTTATFTRKAAGQPFEINDVVADASLTRGVPGMLDISCTTTALSEAVQSITVDLTMLGSSSAQSLAKYGSLWSWSGVVIPPADGPFTLTFTALGETGDPVTATTTLVVAASVPLLPVLTNCTTFGSLTQGQASTFTIGCNAADGDGTIAAVTADLSAIGGSSAQALAPAAAVNRWTWTGTVTPSGRGTKTIMLTATDNGESTMTLATTVQVIAVNTPPTVTIATIAGVLTQGEAGTVTIGCTAQDPEGQLSAVTANLSPLGGAAAQALVATGGNQYSWTGAVTPASQGSIVITFTARDAAAAAGTATATITVLPPNNRPTISGAAAGGTLVRGEAGAITLQCSAMDDGVVASVTANAFAVGGLAAQSLTFDGSHWTWTGTVTPPAIGAKSIIFTAVDDAGKSSTASATVVVAAPPGTLEAIWIGDVTFTETARWDITEIGSESSVAATTVSVSESFQPAALPVCIGNSYQLIHLPTATLLQVNDQVVATLLEPRTAHLYTITATVTAISRSANAINLELDLTLTGYVYPWTGTFTWMATLDGSEHLIWNGTTHWNLGAGVTEDVAATGTLLRQ